MTDERFHGASSFVSRMCSQHHADWQPSDARGDALSFCVPLAQSHACQRGIREHAEWNQPTARAALASSQIVPDDLKVIDGYVRELRASGAFPDGPDAGGACFQPVVDSNIAAL